MSLRSGRLRDIYKGKEFKEFEELQEFRMCRSAAGSKLH
jgi:hypothetical protein